MNSQLIILCALTFIIHLVGTLAYAVRIAGVRTRRLAVSFSLFNVLILASRTSNSFQGPFLSKLVEDSLKASPLIGSGILSDMRWLLLTATFATLIGGVFIPTFQRLFSRAVGHFHQHRSVPRLIWAALTRDAFASLYDTASIPSSNNVKQFAGGTGLSVGVIGLNIAAVALWTVGIFASLYAGILKPELRVTCSSLSSIINGGATILMFVFVDPQLSVMTDDVIEGRVSEGRFRRAITAMVGARFVGTLAAQALLVPSALLIARVAVFL